VNFDVSEEQQLLQDTVGQYIENECPLPRLREIFESEEGHDPALWKGFAEIGLTGLHVSEQYGGAGLEMIDLALATETVAYGGMPGPFFGHALACLALEQGASEEQKKRWLPGLASGELLGTVALGESDGVWQPEQWTLPAGEKLSGMKAYVPYGSISDLIVVGTAGPGLALAERGSSGVEVERYDGVDRARRLDTVVFQEAPCQVLPGGKAAAPRLRDAGLCLLAADAFGVGKRLVDMSVAYAKEREQFGVTIGHFQALKHQLANMALEIEPKRRSARLPSPRPTSPTAPCRSPATRWRCTAASASPGSATSRSGSSARSSTAPSWASRRCTGSARPSSPAGRTARSAPLPHAQGAQAGDLEAPRAREVARVVAAAVEGVEGVEPLGVEEVLHPLHHLAQHRLAVHETAGGEVDGVAHGARLAQVDDRRAARRSAGRWRRFRRGRGRGPWRRSSPRAVRARGRSSSPAGPVR